MKIINLETFLSLPSGTIFMKYEPCIFGELCIKHDSLMHIRDFTYANIVNDSGSDSTELWGEFELAEKHGASVGTSSDGVMRDGLFEEGQLFAVYEYQDIARLIDTLSSAQPCQ